MEDIFFSGEPLLESVGEHEPHIDELRLKMRRCIQQALIPLSAYAKMYERFLELNNMDVTAYVRYRQWGNVLSVVKCTVSGKMYWEW